MIFLKLQVSSKNIPYTSIHFCHGGCVLAAHDLSIQAITDALAASGRNTCIIFPYTGN